MKKGRHLEVEWRYEEGYYRTQPQLCNVQTSRRCIVKTSSGLNQRDFFRYNKKNKENKGERNEIQEGDDYTSVDREIVSTPVSVFFSFSNT